MSDPPSAPPPTIPEAEDPLADIFADIRAVMRVPVAPLVYRRIAAFPGIPYTRALLLSPPPMD